MRLPRHDVVARDRDGETTPDDQADQESGIHEVLVRGACEYDGKYRRGGHEKALKRDEEVDAPAGVVLDEHACGERAACDEEDDQDADVADYGLFGGLVGGGDLYLGGDDDE